MVLPHPWERIGSFLPLPEQFAPPCLCVPFPRLFLARSLCSKHPCVISREAEPLTLPRCCCGLAASLQGRHGPSLARLLLPLAQALHVSRGCQREYGEKDRENESKAEALPWFLSFPAACPPLYFCDFNPCPLKGSASWDSSWALQSEVLLFLSNTSWRKASCPFFPGLNAPLCSSRNFKQVLQKTF